MVEKKVYCNTLAFGMSFEEQPFVIKAVLGSSGDKLSLILSDKTGEVKGCISKNLAKSVDLENKKGTVFVLSGAVLPLKREPMIVVRELKESTEYQPTEVFSGLSQEMIVMYKQNIEGLKKYIKNQNYLQLVNECLCDENLNKLATFPATHAYYGVYVGGCLAATCVVPDMALHEAARYVKLSNGLYTAPPNWDLLVTAGLLHTFGRISFYDQGDPFKKSVLGVRMNYYPILQSSLEKVILEKKIPLTEEEFGNLINVLQVAVGKRTHTMAVSKDGAILRHVIAMYQDCDMIDCLTANHVPQEGELFYFDSRSNRYLFNEIRTEGES